MTLVIWFGGQEVVAGRLTAGDLIAFIFYVVLVVGPLVSLSNLYSQIQAALAAAERIFELLDQPEESTLDSSVLPALPPVTGQIAFRQVSFTYPAAPSEMESSCDGLWSSRRELYDSAGTGGGTGGAKRRRQDDHAKSPASAL